MSVHPAVAGHHVRLPHWMSLPALVAASGLAVTLVVAGALHQSEQRRAGLALDRQAAAVRAAVSAEANRYVDTLTDLSAAIGAQTDLTAADYAAIMSGLDAKRLLGATGVSLVVPSASARPPEVSEVWPGQGGEALALTPGGSAGLRRYVVLSRRLDGSASTVGRDLSTVGPARRAMDAARTRGAPTASSSYVLTTDAETLPPGKRQYSFVVAAPVVSYARDAAGAVGAGDVGQFRGWLVMGMRGQSFLAKTLRGAAAGKLAVQLRDGGRIVAGWPRGRTGRLDRAGPGGQAERTGRALAGAGALDPAVRTGPVDVAGRRWTVSVALLGGLGAAGGPLDNVVLLFGTVVSLLLAALVGTLSRGRDRALIAVGVATTALRADVLRREKVEIELRRRERELAGFAGVAAHDLRTPLSAASAYLEILADDAAPRLDPENQEFLERARAAVGRTDRMLEDLLGYATADQGALELRPVELSRLAADVVAERTGHLPPDAERVRLGRLPLVRGDAGMLRQLLDNLIGNALKYTTAGQSPRVSVAALELEDGWRIEVADRGIGLPADEQAGIFDAFQRGAGSAGFAGSGLGLAICRRIVERHGGTIGVADNPGGGSVFWFALPAG